MTNQLNQPNDYFQEIDLNPMINGAPAPINSALDRRAMHYFGFVSDSQEIEIAMGTTGGPARVLVSWRYGNAPLLNNVPPVQPPIPDVVLDVFGGPISQEVKYEGHHERAHAIVWIDPFGPQPPPQQPVIVRVRAAAKTQGL